MEKRFLNKIPNGISHSLSIGRKICLNASEYLIIYAKLLGTWIWIDVVHLFLPVREQTVGVRLDWHPRDGVEIKKQEKTAQILVEIIFLGVNETPGAGVGGE